MPNMSALATLSPADERAGEVLRLRREIGGAEEPLLRMSALERPRAVIAAGSPSTSMVPRAWVSCISSPRVLVHR